MHEANILWIVIQIALTVKTGDHSFARIDAHIWIEIVHELRRGRDEFDLTCPLEYTCYRR